MTASNNQTPTAGFGSPGPAVDVRGFPVVDPTANVLALVAAADKRQDDLRQAESIRQDGLRIAEHSRLLDMAALRAHYEDKLRDKEAQRIDAIRAVDANAVQRAAEVQADQAVTLATQVATSADALRLQVQATALANKTELSTALLPMQKDISDLRRAQYEAVGGKESRIESKDDSRWVLTAILSAILAFMSILSFVLYVTFHRP